MKGRKNGKEKYKFTDDPPPPHKFNCLKAFTLAEVLITLAIIGVVAALTIPSVITNYQHTQYITSLKKAQSILSSAASMYIAQGGTITGDVNGDGRINGTDTLLMLRTNKGFSTFDVFEGIKANLQIIPTNQNLEDIALYDINGENQDTVDYTGSFIIKDGMSILIYPNQAIFKRKISDSFPFLFMVDVNGPFKKPNRLGIDVFYFIVSTKGQIIPAGADVVDFKDGAKYKTLDGDNCIFSDIKSLCATSSALKGKNPDGTEYFKGIKYWNDIQ